MHSSEDFFLEKIQKHLQIYEESKEKENSKFVGLSKANVVTAKGKKETNGIKSHLGPKKEHKKFKHSGGPPKADVLCLENLDTILEIAGKIS